MFYTGNAVVDIRVYWIKISVFPHVSTRPWSSVTVPTSTRAGSSVTVPSRYNFSRTMCVVTMSNIVVSVFIRQLYSCREDCFL